MKKAVSVTQLNMYIKMLLSNDAHLSDVLVKGEISNFKLHFSGHMYFTLKDDNAAVKCIMFSSQADRISFRPSDGMLVTAAGYVSVYEKSGQYQLYVSDMMEEGEGALYIKFEKLKKQLADEGLFDVSKKIPIPVMPDSIGVVTSSTGSVIKDIINVLDRRYPKYKLIIYPSPVQGKGSELEIAAGIRYFNDIRPVSVIIIARGGGSIEDLWPFNEESLARAIFDSKIPVISAVGHETDYTIADFAADMRAPTPSAAAELAVPELTTIVNLLQNYKTRIRTLMFNILKEKETALKALTGRPVMLRPDEIFNVAALNVDRIAEKMHSAFNGIIDKNDSKFREITAKMELLSPLGTIARGYSVITDSSEHVITTIKDVKKGEKITARVADGLIHSEVLNTEESYGE